MNIETAYSELLKRTGQKDSNILNVYMYGSRVYGNNRSNSDWDFIVIVRNKTDEQFSDNLINVNFYSEEEHKYRLESHEISALECQWLNPKLVLKETISNSVSIDKEQLRASISAKSSNSWVKAKKKLTVPESYNDSVGKKSLWHSLRILDFGLQIATKGYIFDYGSCNDFYDEVMYCNDWSELYEKYKKLYNNKASEFKKHAPKNCQECPWSKDNCNKHNSHLISAIIRWFKNGSRKTIIHRCHMIQPNIWKDGNDHDVCVGSKTAQISLTED